MLRLQLNNVLVGIFQEEAVEEEEGEGPAGRGGRASTTNSCHDNSKVMNTFKFCRCKQGLP